MPVRTFWRAALCGIAVAAFASGATARAEQVTIKVWMHEHPPRIPIDKQIVAEFEKAHPDVKVDYEVIAASEYSTKLLTAFASGAGPDVFNQSVSLVAQYYNAHILAPIDYAAMGYADEKALTEPLLRRVRRHPLRRQALRRADRSQQLRLLPQQRHVEGSRPRSREGFSDDMGGDACHRGETDQA